MKNVSTLATIAQLPIDIAIQLDEYNEYSDWRTIEMKDCCIIADIKVTAIVMPSHESTGLFDAPYGAEIIDHEVDIFNIQVFDEHGDDIDANLDLIISAIKERVICKL